MERGFKILSAFKGLIFLPRYFKWEYNSLPWFRFDPFMSWTLLSQLFGLVYMQW